MKHSKIITLFILFISMVTFAQPGSRIKERMQQKKERRSTTGIETRAD